MNIFRHEFKAHLSSVVTWSLSIALLIYVFSSFFTTIADDADLLNQMIADFPPELLIAFGMDNIDMSTVLGFYGLVFLFWFGHVGSEFAIVCWGRLHRPPVALSGLGLLVPR